MIRLIVSLFGRFIVRLAKRSGRLGYQIVIRVAGDATATVLLQVTAHQYSAVNVRRVDSPRAMRQGPRPSSSSLSSPRIRPCSHELVLACFSSSSSACSRPVHAGLTCAAASPG